MSTEQANIIIAQNAEIISLLRAGVVPVATRAPRKRMAKPSPAAIAYELLAQHTPSILPYIKKPF